VEKRGDRDGGMETRALNVDVEEEEGKRRALDCIGYRCLESYYQPGPSSSSRALSLSLPKKNPVRALLLTTA